jgi:hypothetical protein
MSVRRVSNPLSYASRSSSSRFFANVLCRHREATGMFSSTTLSLRTNEMPLISSPLRAPVRSLPEMPSADSSDAATTGRHRTHMPSKTATTHTAATRAATREAMAPEDTDRSLQVSTPPPLHTRANLPRESSKGQSLRTEVDTILNFLKLLRRLKWSPTRL